MNLPNKLTILRIILTFVLIVIFSLDWKYSHTLALFLFIFAAVTDYYDGKIAREKKIITNFGKFWDPLADKILVSSVFVFFVSMKNVPVKPWMVVLIISREFLVTGLRLIAANENVVISADSLGKLKTVFQLMAIISILTLLSLEEVSAKSTIIGKIHFIEFVKILSVFFTWGMVFLTIISGASIILKNKNLVFSNM